MHINRNNYASFFLDYFEGNLPEDRTGELLSFLEEHPDLKAEFDAFELVSLPDDDVVPFPDKASLKKTDTLPDAPDSENYESLFAAYAEGDLDEATARKVEQFARSDPFYERELQLMKHARLTPDEAIAFPAKAALKKHRAGMTVRQLWPVVSAAAAVLLLAVLFHALLPPMHSPQVAEEISSIDAPAAREGVSAPGELPAPLPPIPAQPLTADNIRETAIESSPAASDPGSHVPGLADQPNLASVTSPSGSRELADIHEVRPLLASGLTPAPVTVLERSSAADDASLQPRRTYYWQAYQEQLAEFVADEADESLQAGETSRQSMEVSQFARNQLQERTGMDIDAVEAVAASDGRTLRELAGVGLSGLNTLLGEPVILEEEPGQDGRITKVVIADLIEYRRGRATD